MSTTNKQTSSAGFLDGFMAGNISSNSSELRTHTTQITLFLKDFETNISASSLPDAKKTEIKTTINKFVDNPMPNNPDENDYFSYSTDLKELIFQIKTSVKIEKLPTEANYLLKRAIYHFLNLAKTLKDSRIIESATEAAMQFK